MQFGLWYDFRNPPPWRVPSTDLYAETFDQIRSAESFGWDAIWLTEHHFTDDGYLPAVNTVAAAIAMITSRVRIGHSVLLQPLHHPLRVAEEGAIIDILSNGRFIYGAGLGYKLDEFQAFGVQRKHRPSLMDESIEIISRAWTGESFSFRGRHFNFDDVAVTPRPVQQPRPPIWLAARAEAPLRRAAKYGDGLLAIGPPDMIGRYRQLVRAAGRDPDAMHVAVFRRLVLSDDPEATWAEVKDHVLWRESRYADWFGAAADLPADRARLEASRADPRQFEDGAKSMIKDVATEISELRELERLGIDHVKYIATLPGYPPSKMLPMWERFAEEVIPQFRP
jgi:probable F420-dependent oxidoreductase